MIPADARPGDRTTAHVIGRCPVPRCRAARRLEVPAAVRHDSYRNSLYLAPEVEMEYAGHIEKTTLQYASEPGLTWTMRGAISPFVVYCTEHHRLFKWAVVAGTYNARKRCSAACQGATGPACDCSCGGDNHGAVFG